MKLSDQIREAIRQSGHSVYHLALSTRIEEKSLRRFMSQQRGLSLTSLDRLTEYLDLRINQGDTPAAEASDDQQS